jgi:hypothetical protein
MRPTTLSIFGLKKPRSVRCRRFEGTRPGPMREVRYFLEENAREAIELQDERCDGANPAAERVLGIVPSHFGYGPAHKPQQPAVGGELRPHHVRGTVSRHRVDAGNRRTVGGEKVGRVRASEDYRISTKRVETRQAGGVNALEAFEKESRWGKESS